MGNRCADHVTPLYPQKLALTSPTGGGRSVGIVRSRTKATEFSLVYMSQYITLRQKKDDCAAGMGRVGVCVFRNLVDFPWHDINNEACDVHTTV